MVRFDEVAQMLRLAGELREMPQGSAEQRRHALTGLAGLVGAQVGLWLEVDGVSHGAIMIRRALDLGWSGERERRAFLRYVDGVQRVKLDPSMPALAQRLQAPFSTFLREQLLADDAWYRSAHVQELRRTADVDSFIYAAHLSGGDTATCFSLHRPWGKRSFSERERRLVDLFHRECVFLHQRPTEPPVVRLYGLSRREQDTLRGLCRGLSEKELAADLGLSPHTVHDYVRSLYRHFGVRSRSELLVRCLAATGRR